MPQRLILCLISILLVYYRACSYIISSCLENDWCDHTVCTGNRHIAGKWKFHPNATKTFYCCDYENLWNTSLCGPQGNFDRNYVGHPTFLQQSGGHACLCDTDRLAISQREQWIWEPDYCRLLEWNATQFCELLGNRTVVLVGDSTMDQTAATLISMINFQHGTCSPQIRNARNDELYFATHGMNFYQIVARYQPDICIFNAGPHMHDLGDIYTVWYNLEQNWPSVVRSSPHTKFVWKTINPGHVNCSGYHAPTRTYEPGPANMDWYGYRLYPEFDGWSYHYSRKLNFTVMDMAMLYLRPDGHSDCMHFCLPGPLDVFSRIFLTMLYTGEI
jgi:hypothetical protein